MQVLLRTLCPDSRVLIVESAWTDLRAKFNEKVGRQLRRLPDGTEFHIHKRYISREDIAAWDRKNGLTSNIEHFGEALCAVSVSFANVTWTRPPNSRFTANRYRSPDSTTGPSGTSAIHDSP